MLASVYKPRDSSFFESCEATRQIEKWELKFQMGHGDEFDVLVYQAVGLTSPKVYLVGDDQTNVFIEAEEPELSNLIGRRRIHMMNVRNFGDEADN